MSATEKPPPVDPAEAGQSNVPRILGLAITFHTLALVFVALRMYTRIVIVKSFGKDDAMMLACVVWKPQTPFPPKALRSADTEGA
jgi:hypothetical protein